MIQQVQACTQQEECDLKKEGELGVLIDQTTNEKSMFLATPEARFCRRINRDSLAQDKYVIFLAADVNIEDPKANPMIAGKILNNKCTE